MNPRLAKEFRSLLFPWCVCAFASLGHLGGTVSNGGLRGALTGLAGFSFYLGCLLLAVLPLGSEFQHRTLSLLFAQPLERSRLWQEKFLAATVAMLALIIVHAVMVLLVWKTIPSDDLQLLAGFIVVTICSAAACTLSARSIIGGMVFAGAAQFAIFALVSGAIYLTYKILGRDPVDPNMTKWPILAVYVCIGAAYSAFMFWLGWRMFAKLQVRDALPSANIALPDWMTPKKLATALRCQPTGSLRNLIRKEIGLQKPIFTIAAVFTACWVIAFLLLLIEPTQRAIYIGVLNGLTVVHIAIIALLAGCVSLGDEKSLGITAWHLTLPVSSRRQWFVKFLVAFATAVFAGLILPLFLSCLTLVKVEDGLVALANRDSVGDLITVLVAIWVLVIIGFWCASFWENTIRAALATIVSLIAIGTCVLLAVWTSQEWIRDGLQTNLIIFVIAVFQLPPDFFRHHEAVIPYCITLVVLAVTFAALFQSLAQFRRFQVQSRVMFKYSLVLALVTFCGSFWCADFMTSMSRPGAPLVGEVTDAVLLVLRQDSELPEGQVRRVMPQELERNDLLSSSAKRWLRNSTIDVHWNKSDYPGFARRYGGDRVYHAELQLPKGVIVSFDWTAPEPPQTQPQKKTP